METKLRIHTWPEKVLQRKCRRVEGVTNEIKDLLDEMFLLMRINKGMGLAANQAGLNLSLIVIEAHGRVFKLINPRITRKEGSVCFSEGCLSFPGLELDIKRYNKIWISALNENEEQVNFKTEGFLSVIFQHEIDHINGTTFIDRISFLQRLKVSPQLKLIARKSKKQKKKSLENSKKTTSETSKTKD